VQSSPEQNGEQAEALDRLTRLQALTAALSEAVSTEQVADVILTQAAAVLGACAAVVARLSNDGRELIDLHETGYPDEVGNALRRLPADARIPLADAVRDQQPVLLANRAERDAHYPEIASITGVRADGALATLPLVVRGKSIGGMGLHFPTARTFTEQDRAILVTVSGLCAQALERARLFDTERDARTRAERAEDALRASEQRHRLLSDLTFDFTFGLRFVEDGPPLLEWVSEGFTKFSGFTLEELNGRGGWATIVHPDDLPLAFRSVERVRGGQQDAAEIRLVVRSGAVRWVHYLTHPVRDGSGRVNGFVGAAQDINDRKCAELALRESEERLRAIIDNCPSAIFVKDLSGRYLLANKACEAYSGEPVERAIGKTAYDYFPKGLADHLGADDREVLETGDVLRYESVMPARGESLTALTVKFPLRDADGQPYAVCGIATDITELQRASEALRDSEERFRSTFEQAAVGIGHVAPDGRWLRVNRKLCDIVGYPPDELMARTFQDITHPEDLEADLAQVRRLLAGEIATYSMEKRYFRKDRSLVWINLTVSLVRTPQGQPKYFISVVEDITEKKQVRDALRESEERLRTLSNNLPDGAIYQLVADSQGRRRFSYISAGVERLLGVTPEQVMADASVLYGLIHEDDRTRLAAAEESALRGLALFDCEFRSRTRSGDLRWLLCRSAPRPLPSGDCAWEGVILDATARKNAESELARLAAESEKRRRLYEAALSNTPDLVYVFDLNHRFVYANEGLLRMWGRTWDEAIGKNCLELGYEAWHAAMHDHEIEQVITTRQPVKGEAPFTGTFGRRIYEYIFVPVVGENGEVEAVAGTTRDVTERKALEGRLRDQAEQLKEADRRKDEFLATLAHELRNPLAPIRNGLQVMKLAAGNAATVEQARAMMERQLRQMARLLDDLLDVSRITRGKLGFCRERVELASVVQSAVEATRPLIEASAHRLLVALPPEPVFVDADPVRLAQVFANLLTNAAKYTDKAGRIWLSAERQGDEVTVTVRDTGIGIAPEHLPRLFEMFSQVAGALERSQAGLGIGLSLVRGLTEMHGGRVEARSEGLGKGSEFVVRLPVVSDQPPNPAKRGDDGGGTARPRRRILVADDNRDAADSLALMLRLGGHEVYAVHDGQEAVDAAAWFRPDLALLDIGMPRVNGYEVSRRIREQSWGQGMVLVAVTGWGQEEDKRRATEAGFDHHLTKPVDPAALERLLTLSTRSR
jgi:PAS domain S-box-containing protein